MVTLTSLMFWPCQHAIVNLNGYMSTNSLTGAQVLAVGDVDGDHYVTNGDMQALLNLLIGGGGSGSGSLESNAAGSSQNVAAVNSLPATVIDHTEQIAADTDLPATARRRRHQRKSIARQAAGFDISSRTDWVS